VLGIVLLYAVVAGATLNLLFGWNTVLPVATAFERVGATVRLARDGVVELSRKLGKRGD